MGFLDKFKKEKSPLTDTRSDKKADSTPVPTLQMPVACPTCGVVLDPLPQRSRKCTECGSKILIRTDRTTKQKVYLTSEGAAAFDAEKAVASAKKKALKRTQEMGLTTADYEAKTIQLTEEFGVQTKPSDVYWALANEQVVLLGDPRTNGYEIQQIYWQMALQLKEEGGSQRHLQQQAHLARLIFDKAQMAQVLDDEASQWRVEVLANACCDVCNLLNGRLYSFDEAIEEMLLPPESCTRDWCNCTWMNVSPS